MSSILCLLDMKLLHRTNIIYALTSSLITLAAVTAVGFGLTRQPSPIPSSIQKQLHFDPIVLDSSSMLSADQSSFGYDTTSQTLRFTVVGNDLGHVVVSEQATPPQFIDFDSYDSKLADTLNRYSAFDSSLGTVYLTRPKTIPSGQMALSNAKGVLLLASSDKDLTDDQWRTLFAALHLDH
jgi:hypothetical protein